MSMKTMKSHALAVATAVLALSMASCVDNDYDLTDNIDLTITVGGDSLMVPKSDTEEMTMDEILSVDSTNTGSMRIASQGEWDMNEGDLYLYADNEGDENKSTITTPAAHLSANTMKGNASVAAGGGQVSLSVAVNTSDAISEEIIEMDEANVVGTLTFSLEGSGLTLSNGFTITLPDYWTVQGSGSKYTASGNKITFNEAASLPTTVTVYPSHYDFTSLLTSFTSGNPGTLTMGGNILLSGYVSSSNASATNLTADIDMSQTEMLSIYGVVEPEIDITVDPMEFTDIDEALQDEETDLDWDNPQIYLTVFNPSNMPINFTQIKFQSFLYRESEPETHDLVIGSDHPETTFGDIIAEPSGEEGYTLGLYPDHLPASELDNVDRQVQIANMVEMMRRIPDKMDVYDIEANVPRDVKCWVDMGHVYYLDVQYYLLAPLCFGESLAIAYNDTLSGWQKDLKDVEKVYNLEVSMDVHNKVPLQLDMTAVLMDTLQQEIPESKMTLTMEPETPRLDAGTPESPSTSHVKISIECPDGDISILDGLVVRLITTNTEECWGVNINQAQSVTLDNIKIAVMGGITFNLN